jgi:FKBP-type peptidyl-prolyl cis-trans isomerase FkpA
MTTRITMAALALAAVFSFSAAAPATAADAKPTAGAAMSPQQQFLADNIKKQGWKATTSGLQYRVIKAVKEGPRPAAGSPVTVHYEGTLIDGKKFDSSYDRQEPATFPLANVIPGWQEGVPMMREGETWEFAIPSDLAYGDRAAGPIPGGSTLIFKVRLLWVATPAADDVKADAPKKK